MDKTGQSLPPQEQQLSYEDKAQMSVRRVVDLTNEALRHPTGTTMNERNETVPNWITPITHESGHKVAELEIFSRGLNDRPHPGGIAITRTPINTDLETGHETPDTRSSKQYWIDPSDRMLYKFSQRRDGDSIKDSDRLSRCLPIETNEIMDEFADLIEGALHPEKQASRKGLDELANASSPDGTKRRGGFIMNLARKVFDPSKVFPKKRSK